MTNLGTGTINYWHQWTLAHLNSHNRGNEGHHIVLPGTVPQCSKVPHLPAPHVDASVWYVLMWDNLFVTKGFGESLIESEFHSKLRVTVKTEPMASIYNYFIFYLQSIFLLFLFSSSQKVVVPFRGDSPHLLLPPQGLAYAWHYLENWLTGCSLLPGH